MYDDSDDDDSFEECPYDVPKGFPVILLGLPNYPNLILILKLVNRDMDPIGQFLSTGARELLNTIRDREGVIETNTHDEHVDKGNFRHFIFVHRVFTMVNHSQLRSSSRRIQYTQGRCRSFYRKLSSHCNG